MEALFCLMCLILSAVVAWYLYQQSTSTEVTQPPQTTYRPPTVPSWSDVTNKPQPYEETIGVPFTTAGVVQVNSWAPPSTLLSSHNASCGWLINREQFGVNARHPCQLGE
jgi:hypothetical protein